MGSIKMRHHNNGAPVHIFDIILYIYTYMNKHTYTNIIMDKETRIQSKKKYSIIFNTCIAEYIH